MQTSITISDDLLNATRQQAKASHRSVDEQLQHWLTIGKIAEENPELPFEFIKNVLLSKKEILAGDVESYEFSS
jgi:hypothetical protein